MAPRETENNTYAKFWGDKQRALWYVMVFSGVVNLSCRLRHVWATRAPFGPWFVLSPLADKITDGSLAYD